MARLLLLRHAKAGWALPGMRDFDRPLDPRGQSDAEAIGVAMGAKSWSAGVTLCSTARRCRETLARVTSHAGVGQVKFLDDLYRTDSAGYLSLVRNHGGGEAMLLVGHNPMIEDLAIAIAGDGDPAARAALAGGFPPCGLAVIRLPGALSQTAPGAGYLEAFLTPADL